jgi:hypothetical protein
VASIVEGVHEVLELALGITLEDTSFLAYVEGIVPKAVVQSHKGNRASPEFVKSTSQANWPVILRQELVTFFIEEDGGGFCPTRGGVAGDPHDNEHIVNGSVPYLRKTFEELIGQPIRPGSLTVAQAFDSLTKSVLIEEQLQEVRILRVYVPRRRRQLKIVRVLRFLPGVGEATLPLGREVGTGLGDMPGGK